LYNPTKSTAGIDIHLLLFNFGGHELKNYFRHFAGFHGSLISPILTRKCWLCHCRSKLCNILLDDPATAVLYFSLLVSVAANVKAGVNSQLCCHRSCQHVGNSITNLEVQSQGCTCSCCTKLLERCHMNDKTCLTIASQLSCLLPTSDPLRLPLTQKLTPAL
jgi:hypothetical protein